MKNTIKGFLVHQTDEELAIIRKPSWFLRFTLPPLTFLVAGIVILMIRELPDQGSIEFFFCIPFVFLTCAGGLLTFYYWFRDERLTLTGTRLKYHWSVMIPLSVRDISREDVLRVGGCDNVGRRKIASLNPLKIHRKMREKRGYENDNSPVSFHLVFTTAEQSLHAFWGSDWEASIRPLYDLIHGFWQEIPPPRAERPTISLEQIRTLSRWNCNYDGKEFVLRRRGSFSPGYLFTMIGITVFWNSIVLFFLADGLLMIPFVCIGAALFAMVLSLLIQPLWKFTIRITKEGVSYRRGLLLFGAPRFMPAVRIGEVKIVYNRKPQDWGTLLDPEALRVNNEIRAPYRIQISDHEKSSPLMVPWLFHNEATTMERIIHLCLSPMGKKDGKEEN